MYLRGALYKSTFYLLTYLLTCVTRGLGLMSIGIIIRKKMHVTLRTLQAKYRSRNRDRAMDRAVDGGPWLWPLLVYNGRRRRMRG